MNVYKPGLACNYAISEYAVTDTSKAVDDCSGEFGIAFNNKVF